MAASTNTTSATGASTATSTPPVLTFKNVTKSFTVWGERPPQEIKKRLVQMMTKRWQPKQKTEFTVLEKISFQIHRGEFVGIMGRNGIGKSTLLKLISGIYHPNQGEVLVKEGVAPLLELGAGFSEELTGYENIFLNAAILGYGRASTCEYVDQIIEFSELGEKIHLPVKNYSSGMLVRLGFSIAAHLKSPIILLDEVLGVGDAGFVEKSTQKIRQLHAEGRTIVLVTHSPQTVKEFCSRCILIENKRVVHDGDVSEGGRMYLELVMQK